jgi:TatD DNase family protein
MPFFDAHNHFSGLQDALRQTSIEAGVAGMVVNGACESDWPAVLELARRFPEVIPSFGYHPWYVAERTAEWQSHLLHFLDQIPAGIGEVGLDRWKEGLDPVAQEAVFRWQLELAAERNLPLSIHCLQAWGPLLEVLRSSPRPDCGFLLHSYGGSRELIQPLTRLGAYFSFPGYFAHPRKARQRETFRHVPAERLLIETDAPDQPLPDDRNRFPLQHPVTAEPLNHPANIGAVYAFAAEWLGQPPGALAAQVEENFRRLFGSIIRDKSSVSPEPTRSL